MKVWKLTITSVRKEHLFTLPAGARVLSVGEQDDKLRAWVRVNQDETSSRCLSLVAIGTGWEFDDAGWRFVGTVQSISGLVWHIFARGEGE